VSESTRIGRALAKFNLGQKFIYLVDEDIDIRDQETLNWALSSRVDPERDIEFIKDFPTFQYDPSTLSVQLRTAKSSALPHIHPLCHRQRYRQVRCAGALHFPDAP